MTREQMADWLDSQTEITRARDDHDHALLDIAAYLRQSCATCQHADTQNSLDGWCHCAAPAGMALSRYPFRYNAVPLDEKCKGWAPKE